MKRSLPRAAQNGSARARQVLLATSGLEMFPSNPCLDFAQPLQPYVKQVWFQEKFCSLG